MFFKKIALLFTILVASVFYLENADCLVVRPTQILLNIGEISLLNDGQNTNTGVFPQKLYVCVKGSYEYLYIDEDCSSLFSKLISVPSQTGFLGFFKGDDKYIDSSGSLAAPRNKFNAGTFCSAVDSSFTCGGLVASYEQQNQSSDDFDTDTFAKVVLNSKYDGTKTPLKSATPSTLYLKYGEGALYRQLTKDSDGNWNVSESITELDQPANSPLPNKPIPVAKSGYKFKGFYTQQNGSGSQIIDGYGKVNSNNVKNKMTSSLASSGTITLYADWVSPIYTITLNKNGGTGGKDYLYAVPGYGVYSDEYGSSYDYDVELPTRSGYVFNGYFSKQEGGYIVIDKFAWEQSSYTGYGEISQNLDYDAEDATSAFSIYAQWTQCASGEFVKDNECKKCEAGGYIEGTECKSCPTLDSNQIGSGKLYRFVVEGKTSDGIKSCAIKLNAGEENPSACASGTNVTYVYNSETKKYVRKSNFKVVGDKKSIPKPDSEIPSEYIASDADISDYCEACTDGKYNINGKCNFCNEGHCISSSECVLCPAGYDCSNAELKNGNNINCPTAEKYYCPYNTFSELGAKKCSSCADGYSTRFSGDSEDGFDGFCRTRHDITDDGDDYGVGCTTSSACKQLTATICHTPKCECTNTTDIYSLNEIIKECRGSFSFGSGIQAGAFNSKVIKKSEQGHPTVEYNKKIPNGFDNDGTPTVDNAHARWEMFKKAVKYCRRVDPRFEDECDSLCIFKYNGQCKLCTPGSTPSGSGCI